MVSGLSSILEADDDRTTCLASTRFLISTDGAAQWGEVAVTPLYEPEDLEDPPSERPEWPVADSYFVDVVKVPPEDKP